MDITITNSGTDLLPLSDIYRTLAVGESITVSRSASDLPRMKGLQAAIAAGTATVTVAPTASELASGLLSAPQAIEAADLAPVAAATLIGLTQTLRIPLTSGGAAGTNDDVTAYALNTVPYKCRVVDMWALVSTNAAGTSLDLRTQAAGAGSSLGTVSANATGVARMAAATATAVVTPGSSVGLFVRRDRSVVGELFVVLRRES